MPSLEAPNVELGSAPQTPTVIMSPSPSEISSASSLDPPNVRATPLFRALTTLPPEPDQPPGQEELEQRLPGYRRIVIPRELTLIELLKQCSGVTTDEEVLNIREAKLQVVAERVGLRRLHVLAPRLRSLILDGSAVASLRDLGIGLVHLKILSVNRCGISSLDGVWGLAALRELHAAGNRLRDLQALAALQKLNTLNLANNPIEGSSRLWTLGVCPELRRLTLSGTPVADEINYRSNVASALPLLTHLDDIPLHDIETSDLSEIDCDVSFDSDCEPIREETPIKSPPESPESFGAGPSNFVEDLDENSFNRGSAFRRRPNTTECAGRRPAAPDLPPRPRTAQETSVDAPTKLQILNTLLDDEWRCTGSDLTSQGAVCGNLARALRRQPKNKMRLSEEMEIELVERRIEEAGRALAAEIPRAPNEREWAKFKEETGIEIDLDFTERPKGLDPTKALDRLEQIEKETFLRLSNNATQIEEGNSSRAHCSTGNPYTLFSKTMNDFELWKEMKDLNTDEVPDNVNDLFNIDPFGFGVR